VIEVPGRRIEQDANDLVLNVTEALCATATMAIFQELCLSSFACARQFSLSNWVMAARN
jgi:hypothetical protein